MQGFEEYLLAGGRVINAVDVFVGVGVEIVVFEQATAAGLPADVGEPETPDTSRAAVGIVFEPLVHPQNYVLMAIHYASHHEVAGDSVKAEIDGIPMPDDKGILLQLDVLNGSVAV